MKEYIQKFPLSNNLVAPRNTYTSLKSSNVEVGVKISNKPITCKILKQFDNLLNSTQNAWITCKMTNVKKCTMTMETCIVYLSKYTVIVSFQHLLYLFLTQKV